MKKKLLNIGELFGGFHHGKLIIGTVRLTKGECWTAIKNREIWNNCMDMEFTPTLKELRRDGWEVKPVYLCVEDK